jgi:hypothetical protein
MNPKPAHTSKDEWLTPPEIIRSLGEFDLDPCSPINRPWPTAKRHFTIQDNGLMQDWSNYRVWLNPPYGKELVHWLEKMSMHNNGVALTFARTDTNAFHQFVFPVADSILFIQQRITFYNVDGTPADSNGGAPSVLIGYGELNSEAISKCGIKGKHLPINSFGVTVIGFDKSWRLIVETVFVNINRPAPLSELYERVEKIAPDKVANNKHFREKIRQTVQLHFTRVQKGIYYKAA